MSHEINQLDIPDRQLLAGSVRPSIWTEIGEAKITHTIFGRARVRIIRKHDNIRRVLLWLAGIAAMVIAAAVWQGLFIRQQTEPVPGEDSAPSPRVQEQVIPPPFQPENVVSPAIPPVSTKEPEAPVKAEAGKPEVITESVSQPVKDLQGNGPQAAQPPVSQPKPRVVQRRPVVAPQPVNPQSLAAGKPQSVQPMDASSNPAEAQPPAGPLPPKPLAAPFIAAPPITPAQAASSPADIIQLTAPLGRHGAVAPPPVTGDQSSSPASAQSR